MRRRSRPSDKLSTTSRRTSSRAPAGRPGELTKLIGKLLAERGADLVPEDELTKLSRNRNVLAALLEASLAALYLEHGFEPIRDAIVAAFDGRIAYALTSHVDHKTELQEELARRGLQVAYTVLDVQGPPHDRTFRCAAVVDGVETGFGRGRSKKAAEQDAAREALDRLALST